MTPDEIQVLEDISAWASSQVPFGHVRAARTAAWMGLPHRAKALISQCQANKDISSVVYAVLNDWERDVLVDILSSQLLETTKELDTAQKICIIRHADLYAASKSINCGGLLDPKLVVICEVDGHYSLEFALGMTRLMLSAKGLAPGGAHILTVSHEATEKSLAQLLRCCVSSATRFRQFNLGHETSEQDLNVHHCDSVPASQDGLITEVVDALKKKEDVLCFTSNGEFIKAVIEKMPAEAYFLALSDKMMPYTAYVKAMRRDDSDTLFTSDQEVPRDPWPVLYVVNDAARTPFTINHLGLVVVSRLRIGIEFDRASGHVLKTLVKRSETEIKDALAHAYLSGKAARDVAIFSDSPLGSSSLQVPRRRLENDQNMAFLFEIAQLADQIHLGPLLNCLITDVDILVETTRRLERGRWLQRRESKPDNRCGYILPSTDRASRLTSILPMLDYDFAPAAFLAGFAGDEPALRAAVRIAAIAHQPDEMLEISTFAESAASIGVTLEEYFGGLSLCFSSFCKIPTEVMRQGVLWAKLCAWHKVAMQTNNFAGDERMSENSADWAILDSTFECGPLARALPLRKNACVHLCRIVDRLERTLGILPPLPNAPPAKIELEVADMARIQDEMLNAWMDGLVWINKAPKCLYDCVAVRIDDISLSTWEYFDPAMVPESPETPTSKGLFALALKIRKHVGGTNEGRDSWEFDNIVILPMASLARWGDVNGGSVLDAARSCYQER